MGRKYGTETWKRYLPLHPVNARSRCNQGIWRSKRHLLHPPVNPMQTRMIPVVKLLASLDHMLREIDRIDSLHKINHAPGNIARASADIQHGTRLIRDQVRENVKNFIGIGWAITRDIDDATIFERLSLRCAEILRFHMPAPTINATQYSRAPLTAQQPPQSAHFHPVRPAATPVRPISG